MRRAVPGESRSEDRVETGAQGTGTGTGAGAGAGAGSVFWGQGQSQDQDWGRAVSAVVIDMPYQHC